MASIYKIILIALLILAVKPGLEAQEMSIGVRNYIGSGSDDLGLEINYSKTLKKNELLLGMELRSIDWGNHLGINLGYRICYYKMKSFEIGSQTTLHPGIDLFKPSSLFSFGISHQAYLRWQSKKASFLQLDLGFRYNISPAYKAYGIHYQFEFPVGLSWGWKF